MVEIRTSSENETMEIGKTLGVILKKGDLVCLSGDLGTGKTAFTKGIALALGIGGYITSPTFTIVNEYSGDMMLYHFDAYRIEDPEEMFEIGLEEYLSGEGIVVIEWAELIREALPGEYIQVNISKELDLGIDSRRIDISFVGGRYREYQNKFNS